ncbi:MAG: transporter, partial [Pseudomonadota bacterium]|nr:transporter [Pseudomonadota bacterium]
SAFFYTDNNDFWNGNKRGQDPLFALQTHIVHTFRHGIWASISAGAVRAGRSTINEEKTDDRKDDFLYALSAGLPVSRTSSIKIAYARGRTHKDVGSDTDNFVVGYLRAF